MSTPSAPGPTDGEGDQFVTVSCLQSFPIPHLQLSVWLCSKRNQSSSNAPDPPLPGLRDLPPP